LIAAAQVAVISDAPPGAPAPDRRAGWGLRLRTLFLHDGRTTSLTTAITQHAGQGAAAASAFNSLSATSKTNLIAFLQSL
jgi:di-heme oxidoreductase (putative peroxidase)